MDTAEEPEPAIKGNRHTLTFWDLTHLDIYYHCVLTAAICHPLKHFVQLGHWEKGNRISKSKHQLDLHFKPQHSNFPDRGVVIHLPVQHQG